MIQVACDRCTQGVMDATNPHYLGVCGCPCHADTPSSTARRALPEWPLPPIAIPETGLDEADLPGSASSSPTARAVTEEVKCYSCPCHHRGVSVAACSCRTVACGRTEVVEPAGLVAGSGGVYPVARGLVDGRDGERLRGCVPIRALDVAVSRRRGRLAWPLGVGRFAAGADVSSVAELARERVAVGRGPVADELPEVRA